MLFPLYRNSRNKAKRGRHSRLGWFLSLDPGWEPPWELGVLELDEPLLLVLCRATSRDNSVLLRSGLLERSGYSQCLNTPTQSNSSSMWSDRADLVRMSWEAARPPPMDSPFPGEFFLIRAGETEVVRWGTWVVPHNFNQTNKWPNVRDEGS